MEALDYLKRAKGPNCKVLVLDENLTIQAERHTFELAFSNLHAGVIEYVPGARITSSPGPV